MKEDIKDAVRVVTEDDCDVETGKIAVIPQDGDLALKYIDKAEGIVIDKETNRRLRWKTDKYIAPLVCFVYAIQFMDKLSNNYASVMGLREDLGMVGSMYSWVGSAFYIGYLVFEFPASLMLQRLPLAKTCGGFIIAWGIILAVTAGVHNYVGFMVLRVLLGMLESAITPAFMLITAQWYRREEQFFRTTLWVMCNGLGNIIGSGTAYGLAIRDNEGTLPMRGWKLLFVIIGVITIVLGVVFIAHIPDTPAEAWFLSETERAQVLERIRDNKQGFGNRHFKWVQFKEVWIDPRTYLYFFLQVLGNIPNGSLTNFGSILITGMGYDSTQALLLNMPTGAVEVVGCFLLGLLSLYLNNRMIVAMISCCINTMCACLLAFGNNNSAKYAGIAINGMSPIFWIALISLVSSNTAGHTKKVTTGAVQLIGYCVGNLIGPQTFLSSEAPDYPTAKVLILVGYAASLFMIALLWWINWRANKKRDRLDERLPPEFKNSEFADLTDFQNPEFRYAF